MSEGHSAVCELTVEDLLAADFKEQAVQSYDEHDRGFWWSAKDDCGVRWTVLVRFWRFSKFSNAERQVEDGWDFELHLQGITHDDDTHFRVERSVRGWKPEKIVDWCGKVWERLGCGYVRVWDE